MIRSPDDDTISMIRLMNVHLCPKSHEDTKIFDNWKNMTGLSINYLVDLSQIESIALGSSPTDLHVCQSITDMIPPIFAMYSAKSRLYKNVNRLLRRFPIQILGKFMKELQDLVSYIYLLQSSINYCSRTQIFPPERVVYRGIRAGGRDLADLYESMRGEMIVWKGFTSTSTKRDYVIEHFVGKDDGVLFEIILHSGDVVADIHHYSRYPRESEFLIAASSAFRILEVADIQVPISRSPASPVRVIPKVTLSYQMSWFEFDIDTPPRQLRF
jgi:hypothetical protein